MSRIVLTTPKLSSLFMG